MLALSDAVGGASSPLPPGAASGLIVYKCGNALCLTSPVGRSERDLLGHGPWPQWDPALSEDGAFIAFRGYYGQGDGEYALYVAATSGCGVRRLTRSIAGDPTWSPDGTWIAFDTSGAGEIWKVRPDGSGLVRIASPSQTYFQDHPAWSPDGAEIAFIRYHRNRGDIWLMRPDGTAKRRLLTVPRSSIAGVTWSRDGTSLAFTVQAGQLYWFGTVKIDDPHLYRRLTAGSADAWNPVWLLRDAGIAYLTGYGGSGDLYVMRPNGSGASKIAALATPQFAWGSGRVSQQHCV